MVNDYENILKFIRLIYGVWRYQFDVSMRMIMTADRLRHWPLTDDVSDPVALIWSVHWTLAELFDFNWVALTPFNKKNTIKLIWNDFSKRNF